MLKEKCLVVWCYVFLKDCIEYIGESDVIFDVIVMKDKKIEVLKVYCF